MSEQAYKRLISGQQQGLLATMARGLLWLMSKPYGVLMWVRNLAFDHGWKTIHRVDVPVVAIGNQTTGGTGKTPIVAEIVRILAEQGHRAGIISRGYGADNTGTNDEKRVLDRLCPGVPHVQNPDRILAAKQLIKEHQVSVIVLDDAFQHRRIHRDLNILLIDATNPFGHNHLLPRGLLREPVSSVNRADLTLITRADQVNESVLDDIRAAIHAANTTSDLKIAHVSFLPTGLISSDGVVKSISTVKNQPVTVLTAIGNPTAFVKTCEQIGANVATECFFADHHHYSPEELAYVVQQTEAAGNAMILTTLKDLVKIPPKYSTICAVQIAATIESSADAGFLSYELRRVTKMQQT